MSDTPSAPSITLVIPAFNEAGYLPRLLDSVGEARRRYHGGAETIEVIVADNASTDDTARIAREWGATVVTTDARTIGGVRNAGARAAHAPLLAFIDADNQVHPETFNAVAEALADPRIVGGASGATLERWSLGILVTYSFLSTLAWLTRFDTGVTFCRRADFERIGGYDERFRFAEDVMFLWALRRLGRARGERLIRARWAKAVFSTRKFDRHGDWHYIRIILSMPLMLSRARREAFARGYWYEPGR